MNNKTTWVLIADSSRARILGTKGELDELAPVEDQVFRNAHPRLREILSDRPGRTFDSVGSGRHAMAYSSDARREDERKFAAELSAVLEDAFSQSEYDRLVVVAAPRMLGELRASFPEAVSNSIVAELDKDLTKVPNSEIPALIEHIWAG